MSKSIKINLESLPIEVRESNLTDSQKNVLNTLFYYNNLDFCKENGYFFITNKELAKKSYISISATKQAISLFQNNNFFERTKGKRSIDGNEASTYILHIDTILQYCINHSATNNNMGLMGTLPNCPQMEDIFSLLKEMNLKIEALSVENKELKTMLNGVIGVISKNGVNGDTSFKCPTEIELDSLEIEEELDSSNNNTSHIIGEENKNTKTDMTSNVMSYDTLNEDNEKENKEPVNSMTSTESDCTGNNNISSIEESTGIGNVENKNNIHSNEVIDEENKLIKTSIETMEQGKSQSSTYDENCPPKNAPHSQIKENNDNEINDNIMTELEVNKFLGQALYESCNLMRETKSYDNGLSNLKKAFIKLEEMGWHKNENIVRKYISDYDYCIEEDMKELENSSKNDLEAENSASNVEDDKSINEDTKTCQKANKWQDITINGRPIEELNDMVLSKSFRLCITEDYDTGMNEINNYINSLQEKGYEIVGLNEELVNRYNVKTKKQNKA